LDQRNVASETAAAAADDDDDETLLQLFITERAMERSTLGISLRGHFSQ